MDANPIIVLSDFFFSLLRFGFGFWFGCFACLFLIEDKQNSSEANILLVF